MKKWMILVLSLALLKLQGTHFQSTMSVTPKKDNEYLIEMKIEKIIDDKSQLIATPKLICISGKPAELMIGSKEESDFLLITAMISQTEVEKNIRTSISMKENGQIVLASDQIVKLK